VFVKLWNSYAGASNVSDGERSMIVVEIGQIDRQGSE